MGKYLREEIVFNPNDQFQKQLWEHAKKSSTNFSGYIKRLIQRDFEGAAVINYLPPNQKSFDLDFDGNGFI